MLDLCRQAERLAKRIAGRDLTPGLPMYVVQVSDLPEEWRSVEQIYGMTSRYLYRTLRPWICPDLGPGPAVLIHDLAMQEDFGDEDWQQAALATFVHELSHVVQHRWTFYDCPPGPPPELCIESLTLFSRPKC